MLIIPELIPTVINPQNAWFDFTNTRSIQTSGNDVVSVTNLFGNGNNLGQTISTKRPKTGTRAHNGLNVLDFDGVDDFLNFNSNDAADEPLTIFVVGKIDVSAKIQTFIGRQTSFVPGQIIIVKNESFNIFQAFNFGALGASSGVALNANLNPNIHCVTFQNGSSLKYGLNTSSLSTDAAISGYDNSVATGLAIGASSNSGGFPLQGWIGEVIIYGYVLTTEQINGINRYLSTKWGIALA